MEMGVVEVDGGSVVVVVLVCVLFVELVVTVGFAFDVVTEFALTVVVGLRDVLLVTCPIRVVLTVDLRVAVDLNVVDWAP